MINDQLTLHCLCKITVIDCTNDQNTSIQTVTESGNVVTAISIQYRIDN